MKNIILIKPYIEDFYVTYNRNFPYGLFLVGSIFKKYGFDVTILDFSILKKQIIQFPDYLKDLKEFYREDQTSFSLFNNYFRFGYSENEIIKIIKKVIKIKGKPLLIGISNFSYPYSIYGDKIALKLREIYDGIIVAGGLGSSFLYKLKDDEFDIKDIYDFVFTFEADHNLKDFIRILKLLCKIENDNGIKINFDEIKKYEKNIKLKNIYSKKYGIEIINDFPYEEKIEYIESDQIFKDFINDLKIFFNVNKKKITDIYPNFSTTFTRGCPYRCSYCYISKFNIPFRKRKIESIILELNAAYNAGFRNFNVDDDSFFYDKDYAFEVLKQIKKRFKNKISLQFYNGLNFHHLNERDLKRIYKLGFIKFISFSIGSINIETQKKINRPAILKIEKEYFFKKLKKYNIDSEMFVIAPLKNQEFFDLYNSISYIVRMGVRPGFSIYYPNPYENIDFLEKDFILFLKKEAFRSTSLNFKNFCLKREDILLFFFYVRILNFLNSFLKKNLLKIFLNFYNIKKLNGIFQDYKYSNINYIDRKIRLNREILSVLSFSKFLNIKKIVFLNQIESKDFKYELIYNFISNKNIFENGKANNYLDETNNKIIFLINSLLNSKLVIYFYSFIDFALFFLYSIFLKLLKKILIIFFFLKCINLKKVFHKSKLIFLKNSFTNLINIDFILPYFKENRYYINGTSYFYNLDEKKLKNLFWLKKLKSLFSFEINFKYLLNKKIKKISIVIPFFERYKYFLFSLYSIFFQTIFIKNYFFYKTNKDLIDFEIIVVDDGSRKIEAKNIIKKVKKYLNDKNSLPLFNKYLKQIFFSNFPNFIKESYKALLFKIGLFQNKYEINFCKNNIKENIKIKNREILKYFKIILREKIKVFKIKNNKGVSYARNYGIIKSKGDIIFFLDSDDQFTPKKIERHIDEYNNNFLIDGIMNEEGWIKNGLWINKGRDFYLKNYFDDNNYLNINLEEIYKKNKNVFSISSLSLKKDFLNLIGKLTNNKYFDTNKKYLEDFNFFIKYLKNKDIFFINDTLNLKFGGKNDQLSYIYRKEIHDELKNYEFFL